MIAMNNENTSQDDTCKEIVINLNKQAGQVKEQLNHTVQSAIERGDDLEDLNNTATHLSDGADQFDKNATDLKKMKWIELAKAKMIYILAILLLLALIIIVIWRLVKG